MIVWQHAMSYYFFLLLFPLRMRRREHFILRTSTSSSWMTASSFVTATEKSRTNEYREWWLFRDLQLPLLQLLHSLSLPRWEKRERSPSLFSLFLSYFLSSILIFSILERIFSPWLEVKCNFCPGLFSNYFSMNFRGMKWSEEGKEKLNKESNQ